MTVASLAITPEAARVAVEEAAVRTYGEATQHLCKHHRIRLSKQMLETLTQTVGTYWRACDDQTLQAAKTARKAPSATISAKRCCVFADGVMVHTDGDWHETRVGTVRSDDVHNVEHKSSIARQCSVDELGDDLWRKACQMGYCQAETKAFIADGGQWLWNQAQRRFGSAIHILDFWHVCDHVSQCAKAFFGEGSDASRQWALAVRGTLRAGLVTDALSQVEALNPRRSPAKRKAKHELITYLTNNRDRMDYPRYERLGLPIGSGEVEAQCKTLVQARCKQSGMRWSRAGLEPLLRVRCAIKDGSYDRQFGHWPTNLAAWQFRRKQQARHAA